MPLMKVNKTIKYRGAEFKPNKPFHVADKDIDAITAIGGVLLEEPKHMKQSGGRANSKEKTPADNPNPDSENPDNDDGGDTSGETPDETPNADNQSETDNSGNTDSENLDGGETGETSDNDNKPETEIPKQNQQIEQSDNSTKSTKKSSPKK